MGSKPKAHVILIRHDSGNQGTFGVLTYGGESFFTGELPWKDNESNLSSIPPGTYPCRMTFSHRFKRKLYEVFGVPNRSSVRIHPANLMGDSTLGMHCQLNGCIALGEKLGWINGQKAVLLSQPAVRKFNDLMEEAPFTLEIRDADR